MALPAHTREVRIASADAPLIAELTVPPDAAGLVLFAPGRHSAGNRAVAAQLQRAGIATLLFDLPGARAPQDLALLTQGFQDATAWAGEQPQLQQLPLGYFGAGPGGPAALIAAARLGSQVAAVVSPAGRADLAGNAALAAIKASTLLIVADGDQAALDLNERAYQQLRCERSLAVVPGANQLFEEPAGIEQVAGMAASWFHTHMVEVEPA